MKLTVNQIVDRYEESVTEKALAHARTKQIDEDIRFAKSAIQRKQLELDMLLKAKSNAETSIEYHEGTIKKLIKHYGQAKSAVKNIMRLKKDIANTEATQERRRRVLDTFNSLK